MIVLDVKNLGFSYDGGTKILSDISFSVEEGEFVAILGANGAGKSTLLRLLNGLLKKYEGEIYIFGHSLKDIKRDELFKTICTVFQDPNDQLFAITVFDDISFGPRNMGLSQNEVKSRVSKALTDVGLEGFESRPIKTLSYGQKKRLCIAGVLAMSPKIMLMDEPLSGLDPMGVREIATLLKKLNKDNGLTVIMATHEVDMVPLFVDKVAVLSKGKLARYGEPGQVFDDKDEINKAKLRLPYIANLMSQLKDDGVIDFERMPLTVGEARRALLSRL